MRYCEAKVGARLLRPPTHSCDDVWSGRGRRCREHSAEQGKARRNRSENVGINEIKVNSKITNRC